MRKRILGEKNSNVEEGGKSENWNRPYKKIQYSSPHVKGWLETSVRMGMTRPVLLHTKKVSLTDIKKDQNRLQLSRDDVENSAGMMMALAGRAKESDEGVAVNVMDWMGNNYSKMRFKCMPSTGHFRINGPDYAKFVENAGVKVDQLMDIWGLTSPRRDDADVWLALINHMP